MKRRWGHNEEMVFDEDAESEALRKTLSPVQPSPPDDRYWANLIVRTNRRIDEVTSAKGISLSWAVRVAIPGVVAIVSFLIGLRYYVPEYAGKEKVIDLTAFPAETIDSLVIASDDAVVEASRSSDIFELSRDQISDYMLSRGGREVLLRTLSEQQVELLVQSLRVSKTL